MFKFKKGIMVSILTAMIVTLSLPVMNVSAKDNNNYAFKNQGQVVKLLTENQVPKDKQRILLDKLKNNQLWDCYDEQKNKQIPLDFYKFDPASGSTTRIYRFEDGSFKKITTELVDKTKIDKSKESISKLTAKIKDKTALDKILTDASKTNLNGTLQNTPVINPDGMIGGSGYSWYYDYKICLQKGYEIAWFYADFCIVQEGPDSLNINDFWYPYVDGFGSLDVYPFFTLVRSTEDVNLSRYAMMNMSWITNYNISTPWGGSTVGGVKYLWFAVGNNSYYYLDYVPDF